MMHKKLTQITYVTHSDTSVLLNMNCLVSHYQRMEWNAIESFVLTSQHNLTVHQPDKNVIFNTPHRQTLVTKNICVLVLECTVGYFLSSWFPVIWKCGVIRRSLSSIIEVVIEGLYKVELKNSDISRSYRSKGPYTNQACFH